MSNARGLVGIIAVLAVGGGAAVAIRQREHDKQVMWAIYSDLHNVATAEEAYFADHASYGMDVTLNGGRPMNGSTVRILRADATSWEATATHPDTKQTCTSYRKGKTWYPPVCK